MSGTLCQHECECSAGKSRIGQPRSGCHLCNNCKFCGKNIPRFKMSSHIATCHSSAMSLYPGQMNTGFNEMQQAA